MKDVVYLKSNSIVELVWSVRHETKFRKIQQIPEFSCQVQPLTDVFQSF